MLFYAQLTRTAVISGRVSGPYRYISVPCRCKLRPLRLEFAVDVFVLIVPRGGRAGQSETFTVRQRNFNGRPEMTPTRSRCRGAGSGYQIALLELTLISYTSQSHVVLITDIFPNAQSLSRAVSEPALELCESRGGRPWFTVPASSLWSLWTKSNIRRKTSCSQSRQELCESRGGRPYGLPSLVLMVSVDVNKEEKLVVLRAGRSCVKVEVAVLGSRHTAWSRWT